MSDLFEKTYEQEKGPEPANFDKYKDEAASEWNDLLQEDPAEEKVQEFLEENPSFVPGAWTPGTQSGHPPYNRSLITQPQLTGFNGKVPDFMWISRHSLAWYPTLIEIERPGKRIFKKESTQPNAKFTQALNQIKEWKSWFSISENKSLFVRQYGVSHIEESRSLQMKPHYIFIYDADQGLKNHVAAGGLKKGATKHLSDKPPLATWTLLLR